MARVKVDIYHLPTSTNVASGYLPINDIEEYDAIKNIFIEAVEGKVSFVKLVTESNSDVLIGKKILKKSKIELTICQ